MIKKTCLAFVAVPLLTASSFAFSATITPLSTALNDVRNGDIAYLTSRIVSRLPQALIESIPKSAIGDNAMRIKNGKGKGNICL